MIVSSLHSGRLNVLHFPRSRQIAGTGRLFEFLDYKICRLHVGEFTVLCFWVGFRK